MKFFRHCLWIIAALAWQTIAGQPNGFDRASFRHYMAWLTPTTQNIRRPDLLVEMLPKELRRHRIHI